MSRSEGFASNQWQASAPRWTTLALLVPLLVTCAEDGPGATVGPACGTGASTTSGGDALHDRQPNSPDNGFFAASTGERATCAIRTQGGLTCWSTVNPMVTIGQLKAPQELSKELFARVAVGVHHACAIGQNGILHCWGADHERMITGGLEKPLEKYYLALTAMPSLGAIRDVALGMMFTCAASTTGVVRCWGDNQNSLLGSHGAVSPAEVPVAKGSTSLASGWVHTCAVTGGNVACWGANMSGQLGHGPHVPDGLPGLVKLPGPVSSVGLGKSRTCAALTSGSVYCWGRTGWGPPMPPAAEPGIQGVTAVAVGSSHVCGITSAKGIRCWGKNSDGQLGVEDSTATDALLPTLNGCTSVSAFLNHTVSVCGGKVWYWGDAILQQTLLPKSRVPVLAPGQD